MNYIVNNNRRVEVVDVEIGEDLYNKFYVEEHFRQQGYILRNWGRYVSKDGYYLRFEKFID